MTDKPPLGKLEPLHLREYWEHEAHHFTPWLADNIGQLGEALGLNLEVEGREVGVGPYRADILARDTDENTLVLVENQLEVTDLIHLGQLMTYAAGLDAATVVWVAADFIDQHRAALEWFNRVTVEGINFFGVKVELWKIGDSAPAPRFEVVAKPNEWSKRMIGARKGPIGLRAPIYDQYRAYWDCLVDFLQKHDYPHPYPKAAAKNWISSRAPLPHGVKINFALADLGHRIWIYVLIYEDKAPGLFAFVKDRMEGAVERVGRPPDLGPREGETGGDFGWRFAGQGFEAEEHEAENKWVAETAGILVDWLAEVAAEAHRTGIGVSDAG